MLNAILKPAAIGAGLAAALFLAPIKAEARPQWNSQTYAEPGQITTSISVKSPFLEAVMAHPEGRAWVNKKLNKTVRKMTRWGQRHGLGGPAMGNSGTVIQTGDNNVGALGQSGSFHDATLTQNGSNSAMGAVQFGCGGGLAPVQTENGEIRLVLQASARC